MNACKRRWHCWPEPCAIRGKFLNWPPPSVCSASNWNAAFVPRQNTALDNICTCCACKLPPTSYDKLGRVTSKSQNFLVNAGGYTWRPFTTTATYNLAGGTTSETYPSGRTVNYAYDDAGRTTSFTGNLGDGTSRNYATQMTYLPAGQLTKELFGTTTALYQRLNYNTRQQLYAVRVGTYNGTTYDDNPQAAQSSQATSWDRGMLTWRYGSDDATTWGAGGANNNGNVLYAQHWIPGASSYNDTYEYDQLNRLTKVTESGNAAFVQAFDYDRYSNRTINQTYTTNHTDLNKKPFTVNTANNRLGVPNGQSGTMTYDNVGNLITDTYTNPNATGAMEYDAENHMTSAVNGSHQYRYNADGKRTRRIIASVGEFWMVYGIGGELVAEYNATSGYPTAGTPTKEFGYRNGKLLVMGDTSETVANMQFKWLVQDHLGSTRMEIGKDGTAVVRHDYLPFGEELKGSLRSGNGYGTATKTKQKFTGHERDDETGLDFAQARYLSGIQGRFTSTDPARISIQLNNPQTWNRYSYVLNNPLANVDDNGKWSTPIHTRIIDLVFIQWSEKWRDTLKKADWDMDDPKKGGQNKIRSYQHAMRGDESPQEAEQRFTDFVKGKADAARRVGANSIYEFGQGLHTLMDWVSPSHEGFQAWWLPSTAPTLAGNLSRIQWQQMFAQHEEQEKNISDRRMGMAVAIAFAYTLYTYGERGVQMLGYTPGGADDPYVREIRNPSDLTETQKEERRYEYNMGLTIGRAQFKKRFAIPD